MTDKSGINPRIAQLIAITIIGVKQHVCYGSGITAVIVQNKIDLFTYIQRINIGIKRIQTNRFW